MLGTIEKKANEDGTSIETGLTGFQEALQKAGEDFSCQKVDLSFKNLSFSIDEKTTILHPVSGFIPSGSLVAVMGPSVAVRPRF